jgi:hypothetical protein
LKGVIRNKLRRPISRMIIMEEIKKGSHILIGLGSGGNIIWNTSNEESTVQPDIIESDKQLIDKLE